MYTGPLDRRPVPSLAMAGSASFSCPVPRAAPAARQVNDDVAAKAGHGPNGRSRAGAGQRGGGRRPSRGGNATIADLRTRYLGRDLQSPLVAAPSPLTKSLDGLRRLEAAGAGAVVLPSLFEEELAPDRREGAAGPGPGDQAGYGAGPDAYLSLVEKASQDLSIPVIASLNGVSRGGWSGSGFEAARPAFQVALLGQAGGAAGGRPVVLAGGGGVAGQLQQVGPDRVQAVVAGQPAVVVQGGEQVEAGPGAAHHGQGHGVVEGHDRAGGEPFEQLVEDQDLRPVGVLGPGRLVVHGGPARPGRVRPEG